MSAMETQRKEKLVWARGGAMRKAVWRENWHLNWEGIAEGGTQTQLSPEEVWRSGGSDRLKTWPQN